MPDAPNTSPTVPNSFARPPRIASEFLERYNQGSQQEQQPQTPRVESQHVDAGGPRRSSSEDYFNRQFNEQQYQQPQPQQPQYSPSAYELANERQISQQLAQERDLLQQQVAQQNQVIQQLAQQNQQWAAQQSQATFEDQLLQDPDMQQLETLDPEDARRIARATARAFGPRVDALQNELVQQRQAHAQQLQYYQQREADKEHKAWANAVVAAHPDFVDLYKDPEFLKFLQGRDGYNRFSRDQMATAEFNAGNTAYVIDMIDRFKRGHPNSQYITSPAPVQVAGQAVRTAGPTGRGGGESLAELNSLMQTRQISQDEYRERLKAWRAANSR